EMVGKEDLPNAIAMNSMMFNSARIIGPSIAGILLAILGAGWCFTINAVSYIAVIAGLLAMKMPPHRANPISGSPLNQVSSGIKYVLRNPDLWGLLLLASVFGVFGISYSNILPAFAEDFLKSGATGYGALNAFMGVGALVGAFLVALYSDSGKRGAMLNIANLFYPIVLGVFAWVPHLLPSLGLICLLGVGFMVQMAMTNTLLQTSVDDEYRGRVMSLYALTFFGFSPFGSLLIGTLAQNWGSSIAIGICAVITWVVSRWVMLRTPRIRKLP
ncbi:MAG: MFS transporter, partial [Anaerolineaceae bacterium]|nr:MFS transporter [Anaerolineaceae bacterium]